MDENKKSTNPNLDPATTTAEPTSEQSATDGTTKLSDESLTSTAETAVESGGASVSSADEFINNNNSAKEVDAPDSEHKESSMMPMVVGAIILALVAIAAVWFFTSNGQTNGLGAQIGTDMLPETAGDPDEVIVVVNDVELTRAEYNRIRQQVLQNAQMMGMDISSPDTQAQVDEQAIDTLINTELIRQAAVASGSTVTSEEIEARYDEIVMQVGGEEALADSLAQLGLTNESLRADVEQELVIQRFLDQAVVTDDLVVTDTEVDELYEASGGAEAGLPPIDEVRPQIEQQILINKENELINELIESLRVDAEIESLL